MGYPCLLVREGKAPNRKPSGQFRVGLLGVFFGFAEDDKVVCVSDQTSLADIVAAGDVFHTDRRFHAVQCDVGEQRADDAALRRAAGGVVIDPALHKSCFQPLANEFPTGKSADSLHQIIMVDIVERSPDVGIENPLPPPRWGGDGIDSSDGVMTSATRPESVAARLETSLPERFEGVLN